MRIIYSEEVREMGKRCEPWEYLDGLEYKLKPDTPDEIVQLYDEYKKRLREEHEEVKEHLENIQFILHDVDEKTDD